MPVASIGAVVVVVVAMAVADLSSMGSVIIGSGLWQSLVRGKKDIR